MEGTKKLVLSFLEKLHFHGYIDHDIKKLEGLFEYFDKDVVLENKNISIGFAEWCDNNTTQISKGEWGNFQENAESTLTTTELLQIYKSQL